MNMYSRMANVFYQKMREKNPDLPTRIGVYWSKEEEDNMLDLVESGKNIKDIAEKLQRTEGSIKGRLLGIARDEVSAGATIEEASKLVKLPVEEIQLSIEKNKAKKPAIKKEEVKEETLLDVMKDIRTLLKELNSKL